MRVFDIPCTSVFFHSVSSFVTGSKLSSAPNGNRPETVTLSKPQPVWGPSREDCSLNRRNRDIQYQIVYSVNPPKLEAQYWIYHIIYITFDRCLSAVVVFPFLLIIIFMYFRGQPSQSFIHSNDQGINPVGLLHPQISKMDQNGRSFLIGPPTSPFLGWSVSNPQVTTSTRGAFSQLHRGGRRKRVAPNSDGPKLIDRPVGGGQACYSLLRSPRHKGGRLGQLKSFKTLVGIYLWRVGATL